jgi:pimeloyl-ACP methyl ester carboxylesterase
MYWRWNIPGTGFINKNPLNSDILIENAKLVFEFVIKQLGYDKSDIILMGRSMGSGPACYLAS